MKFDLKNLKRYYSYQKKDPRGLIQQETQLNRILRQLFDEYLRLTPILASSDTHTHTYTDAAPHIFLLLSTH